MSKKNSKIPRWVELIDRELRRIYYPSNFINKFYPSIFDHYYYEGEKIVGEPYGTTMEALEPFIRFCKEHGLRFSIRSDAKHHPNCIRIIVEKVKRGDI